MRFTANAPLTFSAAYDLDNVKSIVVARPNDFHISARSEFKRYRFIDIFDKPIKLWWLVRSDVGAHAMFPLATPSPQIRKSRIVIKSRYLKPDDEMRWTT